MNNLIDVGQVVNTHGLKGEIKVIPWTDAPEVFELLSKLYTKNGNSYTVKSVRYQKNCVLIKLSEIVDVNEAEKLRGTILYTDRDIFNNLPEDTYLVADIVGLKVIDSSRNLGVVVDVLSTGSNDVYSVKNEEGKMIYLPAIKDVVKEINISEGYISVAVPKGLED